MPTLEADVLLQSVRPHDKQKVLLVDDDESILKTVTSVLQYNGFEVTAASNVNQALAFIGSQTFDILVSDLHMPEPGDGLTVVSAMRHSNPKAVTLIFSAYPEMNQAAAAILKQAERSLIKPLGVDNLVTTIRERLKQGAGPAPPPLESVAEILEHSTQSTIEDWLASVLDEPDVISVPLDDHDRCAHLPQLFRDLVV